MAHPNEDRYDRTYDALEDSAVNRRAEKKRMQRISVLAAVGLVVLLLLCLIILVIGTIAQHVSGPEEESGGFAKDKVQWGSVTVSLEDVKKGALVLSNDTHSYSLSDTDASLSKIYDYRATHHKGTMPYQLAGMSQYMNGEALAAMDAFLTDCAAATGTNSVILRMAFLTTAEQVTYQSSLRDHAKDYLTGYGCDLRISGDGASYALTTNEAVNSWLNDNAAKYGFVVRYPADKADVTGVAEYTNYFRYVGVPHATYMKENNLCLEEYIQLLTQYTSTNRLSVTAASGKVYEIYYCAVSGNTSVSCPTNYAYTISGTNAGGVVVTIDRSAVVLPEPEGSGTDTTADTSTGTTADTAAGS